MTALAPEIRRFLRFALVGVVNTAITLTAFAVLERLSFPAPAASAGAFAAGAVNGYLLNSRWTFAGSRRGAGTVTRYVVVQAIGALVSAATIALVLAALRIPHLAAEALVVPAVTIVTYALARLVVFRPLPSSAAVSS